MTFSSICPRLTLSRTHNAVVRAKCLPILWSNTADVCKDCGRHRLLCGLDLVSYFLHKFPRDVVRNSNFHFFTKVLGKNQLHGFRANILCLKQELSGVWFGTGFI